MQKRHLLDFKIRYLFGGNPKDRGAIVELSCAYLTMDPISLISLGSNVRSMASSKLHVCSGNHQRPDQFSTSTLEDIVSSEYILRIPLTLSWQKLTQCLLLLTLLTLDVSSTTDLNCSYCEWTFIFLQASLWKMSNV